MFDLVELTEPGPFAPRTIEMGTYLGVRDGTRLVAMAGQRVRLDGYTEISAVCTDPRHRGRGLAGALVTRLVDEIHTRGDVPILHAVSTNAVAISRYRSLGFVIRREVEVAVLVAPS
jgi:predicted GNAT family acetyltransferase